MADRLPGFSTAPFIVWYSGSPRPSWYTPLLTGGIAELQRVDVEWKESLPSRDLAGSREEGNLLWRYLRERPQGETGRDTPPGIRVPEEPIDADGGNESIISSSGKGSLNRLQAPEMMYGEEGRSDTMRKGSRVSAKTRESVSAKQYPVMPLFWERLISWKFPGHLEASPLLGQQSFIALPVLRTPCSIRKWEVPDGF